MPFRPLYMAEMIEVWSSPCSCSLRRLGAEGCKLESQQVAGRSYQAALASMTQHAVTAARRHRFTRRATQSAAAFASIESHDARSAMPNLGRPGHPASSRKHLL